MCETENAKSAAKAQSGKSCKIGWRHRVCSVGYGGRPVYKSTPCDTCSDFQPYLAKQVAPNSVVLRVVL